MTGKIHSIETFGTVDGPGVRLVVFLQGCPLRCAYCHNPDTWPMDGGKEMEVDTIINDFQRNRGFYRDGGITVTGGEPLMQIDFLIALFTEAKSHDIHTCIDTSGITYNTNNVEYIKKLDRLMELTDLIMLDIKHINSEKHEALTSKPNENILAFSRYLSEKNVPVWIRHVVVPGLTDDDTYLFELGYYIGDLTNLKAIDILPYHTMGTSKYESLGLEYKLKDVPAMDKELVLEKKKVVLEGIKKRRSEL